MKLSEDYLLFLAHLHRFAEQELPENLFDEVMSARHWLIEKNLNGMKGQAEVHELLEFTKAGTIYIVKVASTKAIVKVSKEQPF